jgi:hypothetical protein
MIAATRPPPVSALRILTVSALLLFQIAILCHIHVLSTQHFLQSSTMIVPVVDPRPNPHQRARTLRSGFIVTGERHRYSFLGGSEILDSQQNQPNSNVDSQKAVDIMNDPSEHEQIQPEDSSIHEETDDQLESQHVPFDPNDNQNEGDDTMRDWRRFWMDRNSK